MSRLRRLRWLAPFAVGMTLTVLASCGGDDDAGSDGTEPEDDATEVPSDDGDTDEITGDATAELTVDGNTYTFEAVISGCLEIDDGTGFVGHGAGPDGSDAELSVSYFADPPGSDLPGGDWDLSAIEEGDTPGIATGDTIVQANPGMIRTEGDGFEVEFDGSTIRIAGPAEDEATGTEVPSELVVHCG